MAVSSWLKTGARPAHFVAEICLAFSNHAPPPHPRPSDWAAVTPSTAVAHRLTDWAYRFNMARLLVVEDDETIGGVMRSSLAAHGHDVTWVMTGADALRVAAEQAFELIMLDLGLPDMDGVDVCVALRKRRPGAVVVVLTARDEEIDVIVGLEAGADDYLTKPFRLGELLARIQAHLRRSAPMISRPVKTDGPLRIDEQTRRAYLGNTELLLRSKEFDLLVRFLASPGAALSRATLMADVWDPHWFGSTKTLDVHVSSLRSKFQAAAVLAGVGAPAIVAVRAFGYRLESDDSRG